jgi:hypothetical protein
MAQQTAVEWLIDQVEDFIGLIPIDIIQQAKEMEEQQIVKAVNVGFDEGCKFPEDIKLGSGEQYYTQTYTKKQQNKIPPPPPSRFLKEGKEPPKPKTYGK